MEYDGIITKFKSELLDGLLDDENSCVEVYKKRKEHVTLLPYHLHNIKESLTSILDIGISKYHKKYNGVLLAHKNIKVLPTKSVVNREYVYIHMDIEADFYIFKPEVDKVLNGVVNKYSPRHVGVLIYNTFNVSIPKPQSDDEWLGEQVNIGQEVVLRINFINYEARLPYITAELISIKENQSNESTKIKFDTDDSQVKVKSKKKKKNKDLCEENGNGDAAEETLDRKVKKRKKVKEVSLTAEFNFTDENSAEEVESSKKHKKKREKSSQKNDVDTTSTENDENVTKKKKRRSKGNNLLEEDGNISGITKLEISLDENNLEKKKKEKKRHSTNGQDLNCENDQSLKKNKIKRNKSCHELEENNCENDDFSYDFDKPLNLENLIDSKNISATSDNIYSVDYNIKKVWNKHSSSTGTDSSITNLKKEILYDSEVENMMKDFGFKSETETTKKRKQKSSFVNYDIEDVKSKKIKTEL